MSTPGAPLKEPFPAYSPTHDAKPLWLFGAALVVVVIALAIAL